jgi:hypothetical protein
MQLNDRIFNILNELLIKFLTQSIKDEVYSNEIRI